MLDSLCGSSPTAGLSGGDRGHMAHKAPNIWHLTLYRKRLLTPVIESDKISSLKNVIMTCPLE